MVTAIPPSELAFLQAQIGLLAEELADVKRERNAFRQELSYYREKAAKYISLADEHNSTIRDLERDLERTRKLAKMSEAHGNASQNDEHIRENIIDLKYPSMNHTSDSQNRLVSPETQSSLQGTVDVTKGYKDAEILHGTREISLSNELMTDQHEMKVDLKRSRDIAQLQNRSDLPTKRLRTRKTQFPESPVTPNETQNSPYEDRNGKEIDTVQNDPPEEGHCSNHGIPLEMSSKLDFEVNTMLHSRRPSISQATNVTMSPEIPRSSHAVTIRRSRSHVQQRQDTVIAAEAFQQNSSSNSLDLLEHQGTDSKPGPASKQELLPLDAGLRRRDSDAAVILPSEISLSEFLHRRPFQIHPFPKWTQSCENVTSFSIRRLLGGLTGPGATFTETRNGRAHLFLQRENCPSLPRPGEPSVVYIGFPSYVNSDVRVFIHRGVRKSQIMWEYAGDYKCILKRLNPYDFKKESFRFREEFVQKLLFEQEFQSHHVSGPQSRQSTRVAELRAIDTGDKTVYIALIECYKYDRNFADDLVQKCTNLYAGSSFQVPLKHRITHHKQ